MKRMALWLALALTAAPTIAETVYVNDMLRVGVRSKPNSSESPLVVVTTGAALDVLERQGGYLRVRTTEGKEGWVNKVYVSGDPPARERLQQLQKEFQRVQLELDELRADSAHALEENDALEQRVGDLLKENSAMHQKLSEFYDEDSQARRKQVRYAYAAALVLLFVFGVYLGARWHKQRVAERLGGIEV